MREQTLRTSGEKHDRQRAQQVQKPCGGLMLGRPGEHQEAHVAKPERATGRRWDQKADCRAVGAPGGI